MILDKINTLVANVQELKIDRGEVSKNVRQWKKEIKESYTPLVEQMGEVNGSLQRKTTTNQRGITATKGGSRTRKTRTITS